MYEPNEYKLDVWENASRELFKNTVKYLEQILEATPNKIAVFDPPASVSQNIQISRKDMRDTAWKNTNT